MNYYELAAVLEGKATPAKKKAFSEKIEKMVSTMKGVVLNVEDWGEKDLAYEIKGNKTGTFMFFTLELDGAGAKNISSKMALEDSAIRSLLVRMKKPADKVQEKKEVKKTKPSKK